LKERGWSTDRNEVVNTTEIRNRAYPTTNTSHLAKVQKDIEDVESQVEDLDSRLSDLE